MSSFTDIYNSAVFKASRGMQLSTIETNLLQAASIQLELASKNIPQPPPPTQEDFDNAKLQEDWFQYISNVDAPLDPNM